MLSKIVIAATMPLVAVDAIREEKVSLLTKIKTRNQVEQKEGLSVSATQQLLEQVAQQAAAQQATQQDLAEMKALLEKVTDKMNTEVVAYLSPSECGGMGMPDANDPCTRCTGEGLDPKCCCR